MNRWDHIFFTTLVCALVWVLVKYLLPSWIPPLFSFLFLFVAWLGGIFPDFDSDWKPLLGHRSFVTHSILAPLLLVIVIVIPLHLLGWIPTIDWYFVGVFLFACGWHLWLDLYPSSRSILSRWLKKPLEATPYVEHGRRAPPGNITMVPKKWERPWLIINGLILIAIAAILWVIF